MSQSRWSPRAWTCVGVAAILTAIAAGRADARNDLIVQQGDAAPGLGSDAVFRGYSAGLVNEAGQVLFVGEHGQYAGYDPAMWLRQADGTLVPIVRRGDAAPLLPSGVTISTLYGNDFHFNDLGQVVFNARLTGTGVNDDNDVAYWLWSTSNTQLVLRDGDHAHGIAGNVNYNLSSGNTALVNNAGMVYYGAYLSGDGVTSANYQGLWSGAPGNIGLLVRGGDTVPATSPLTVAPSVFFSLSDSGVALIRGTLSGPSVTSSNDTVLLSYAPDASPRMIARESFPVPDVDGAQFSGFFDASISASGAHAFTGYITSSLFTGTRTGLWSGTPGDMRLRLLTDQPVPGNNTLYFDALDDYRLLSDDAIIIEGTVTFGLDGSPWGAGIWSVRDDQTRPIVLDQQQVTVGTTPMLLRGPQIIDASDSGLVLIDSFLTTLGGSGTNNVREEWIGDGYDLIHLGFDDAPAGRTVTGARINYDRDGERINRYGQVSYVATFDDGSTGLYLWTPDLHWRGTAGDGLWNSASNWTLSLNPAQVHDVYLDADTATTITGPLIATVRRLTIGGGAGQTTLVRSPSTLPQDLTATEGVRLTSNGVLAGFGRITGDVSQDGGRLSPGTSESRFADLTIDGDYTITGGSLSMEFGQNGQSDALHVTGDVTLGGLFSGERFGFFTADRNTLYTIITAASVTGEFDTTNLPYFGFTHLVKLIYNADSVVLHVFAKLTGDANNDGVVDAADVLAVEQHFGTAGVSDGSLLGDANDDGRVDGADALFVERNMGAVWEPAPTPEPGVGVIVLIALAAGRLRRR